MELLKVEVVLGQRHKHQGGSKLAELGVVQQQTDHPLHGVNGGRDGLVNVSWINHLRHSLTEVPSLLVGEEPRPAGQVKVDTEALAGWAGVKSFLQSFVMIPGIRKF